MDSRYVRTVLRGEPPCRLWNPRVKARCDSVDELWRVCLRAAAWLRAEGYRVAAEWLRVVLRPQVEKHMNQLQWQQLCKAQHEATRWGRKCQVLTASHKDEVVAGVATMCVGKELHVRGLHLLSHVWLAKVWGRKCNISVGPSFTPLLVDRVCQRACRLGCTSVVLLNVNAWVRAHLRQHYHLVVADGGPVHIHALSLRAHLGAAHALWPCLRASGIKPGDPMGTAASRYACGTCARCGSTTRAPDVHACVAHACDVYGCRLPARVGCVWCTRHNPANLADPLMGAWLPL